MVPVEVLQIRDSYGIVYNSYEGNRAYNRKSSIINNIGGKSTYSGKVTNHAKKRISRACTIMVQKAVKKRVFSPTRGKSFDFRLGFLTLTIPDLTSNDASYYYRVALKPFLRILKNKYGVDMYVWKAELQARGSIHYHLTINQFIDYTYLRDDWNRILNKANLMTDYIAKYGNTSPNSVDIRSVKHVKSLTAYLIKYISKEGKDAQCLKGKVWGCSDSLRGAKYYAEVLDSKVSEAITTLYNNGKLAIKWLEQCTIINWGAGFQLERLSPLLARNFEDWRKVSPIPI